MSPIFAGLVASSCAAIAVLALVGLALRHFRNSFLIGFRARIRTQQRISSVLGESRQVWQVFSQTETELAQICRLLPGLSAEEARDALASRLYDCAYEDVDDEAYEYEREDLDEEVEELFERLDEADEDEWRAIEDRSEESGDEYEDDQEQIGWEMEMVAADEKRAAAEEQLQERVQELEASREHALEQYGTDDFDDSEAYTEFMEQPEAPGESTSEAQQVRDECFGLLGRVKCSADPGATFYAELERRCELDSRLLDSLQSCEPESSVVGDEFDSVAVSRPRLACWASAWRRGWRAAEIRLDARSGRQRRVAELELEAVEIENRYRIVKERRAAAIRDCHRQLQQEVGRLAEDWGAEPEEAKCACSAAEEMLDVLIARGKFRGETTAQLRSEIEEELPAIADAAARLLLRFPSTSSASEVLWHHGVLLKVTRARIAKCVDASKKGWDARSTRAREFRRAGYFKGRGRGLDHAEAVRQVLASECERLVHEDEQASRWIADWAGHKSRDCKRRLALAAAGGDPESAVAGFIGPRDIEAWRLRWMRSRR